MNSKILTISLTLILLVPIFGIPAFAELETDAEILLSEIRIELEILKQNNRDLERIIEELDSSSIRQDDSLNDEDLKSKGKYAFTKSGLDHYNQYIKSNEEINMNLIGIGLMVAFFCCIGFVIMNAVYSK